MTESMAFESIETVPLFKYGLIMADPPWHFALRSEAGEDGAQAHLVGKYGDIAAVFFGMRAAE